MTTDRTFYIGGEDIWYTLANINVETNQNSTLSKVAYVELLNQANVPVIQEKVYLTDGMVTSKVTIPDTASTGNYLLRAYTRWMTNYSAHCFESQVVSIVNPFVGNALPEEENLIEDNGRTFNDKLTSDLIVSGLKAAYPTRQKITLSVETKNWKQLTVSIVKSCLYKPYAYVLSEVNPESCIEQDVLKVPEHKGEIIEGVITDIQSGKPVVNEKMMLSFVGQHPVLKFSTTDSVGGFVFEVNRFGVQEMVIQPYSTDTVKLNYKVTLKDSYSGRYPIKNIPDLVMDSTIVRDVNEAIVNMQVNTIYSSFRPDVVMADSIEKAEAFYGRPENTVLIDKYIELPTTEEVIREIVPMVFLRKSEGEYYVKVFEDKSYYPKEGKTMTFVDGVPISEFKRILNISPEYLEKIDVLNLNYYYEDENLGRLLMFYTRNGDMGNMDFDHRLFRQVHKGFENSYTYLSPDYTDFSRKNSRLADFRNMLFFAGFNNLEKTKPITFDFTTGDDVTDYTLILTGINEKGQKETVLESFKVE
jgi:hypothetical protein